MPRHGRRIARSIVVLVVATLFVVLGAADTALAATIQVTTSADENNTNPAACSLREAVTAANTNAAFGGCPAGDPDGTATDQITFAAGTNGSAITLGGSEIIISSNLDIVGNSATNTQVSGNNASSVFVILSGTVSISDLTIRNGLAALGDGGGISNSGTLTVSNSTLSSNTAGNVGGGIFIDTGSVTINSSTLTGNSAAGGGGIFNDGGALIVTNSTFSGNSAGVGGGALFNDTGSATIINTTLSGNAAPFAGGISSSGTVNLRATILDTGASGGNCNGVIGSLGSNLSDDNTCAATFNQTGDLNNATLNLGPLADNNGPTFTHALQAGSAAIDAVQGSCTSDGTGGGTVIATDQRTVSRPKGAACDAGAFESGETRGALQFSAPTFSVGEAGPTASVTVTRTGGSDFQVGATVSLTNGTATAPTDYTATALLVSFAGGDSANKTVNIPIIEDALDEADETVNLTLGSPTGGATIGAQSAAVLTITDNDPTPTLSIDDVTLAEGNAGVTVFTFTVSLSAVSGQQVTVQAQTADSTGTVANSDYTAAGPATLTFVPGDTSETFTVQVTGDATSEAAETFLVNLSSPVNATILDGQGVGTITNDDGPPSLSVSDPAVTEGDAGTATLTFTVNLGPAAGQPVTVQYATANGTATSGAACTSGVDYQPVSGGLTFQAGETNKTVAVTVCSDTLIEGNETVLLNLSTPTVATILDGQGQGTITDDDSGGTVTFTAATATVNESAGTLTLTVQRSASGVSSASQVRNTSNRSRSGSVGAAALGAITVRYATNDGTAAAGRDYTSTSGTLSFGLGETTQTITVPIRDDADTEPSETFTVTLSNATGGGNIGSPASVTVTLRDTSVLAPALQGQDNTDPSRKNTKEDKDVKKTEEEQQQRERTNRSGQDDYRNEGNVVEVHPDADPPYVVIVNRDGRVKILLHGEAAKSAGSIKVGDYLEAEGEKVNELLFEATDVSFSRSR